MSSFEAARPTEATPLPKLPYEATVEFVRAAKQTRAPQLLLGIADYPYYQNTARKGLYIIDKYYGTDLLLVDIAEELACSPFEAGRKRNITFTNLWTFSPESLRQYYPLKQLERNKPRTIKTKMKQSDALGGIAIKVNELLNIGKTLQEITDELSLSQSQLEDARYALRKFGLTLPTKYRAFDIQRSLDSFNPTNLTDRQKAQVLGEATLSNYHNNSGPDGKLVNLREVVEKAGYRFSGNNSSAFANALAEFEVPFAKVSKEIKSGSQMGRFQQVRFLFRSDLDRAVMTLKYNPKFARYLK